MNPCIVIDSDSLLVSRAKEGDDEAFRLLMQRHKQQILSTVMGMLGDTEEVYDVSQEVFINFYRSLHKFRGDSKVNTYLTRIAINLSLNELKRRKRKKGRFGILKESTGKFMEDDSQNPERQDNKELVTKALQYLDKDLRSVIVLRMIDGYSTKETAKVLEIPLGTVLSRLSRGRDKLKTILKQIN